MLIQHKQNIVKMVIISQGNRSKRYKIFIAIMIALFVNIQTLRINKISDKNLNLLNNGKHSIILFTLQNHPSYQSIKSIRQKIRQYCINQDTCNQNEKWQFFEAQLSKNTYLQQIFNVKRFPYLGFYLNRTQISTQPEKGIQFTKFYKYRGIVSQVNIIGIILRMLNYEKSIDCLVQKCQQSANILPYADYNTIYIKINLEKILKNEESKFDFLDFMTNKIILNDLYSQMNFVVQHIQKAQLSNQINQSIKKQQQNCSFVIASPFFESKQVYLKEFSQQSVIRMINQMSFQLINQFTPEFFTILQNHFQSNSLAQQMKPLIFAAVLDSVIRRQETIEEHIPLLQNMSHKWSESITIVWMEAGINPHKKVLLGFGENDESPLFALFNSKGKNIPMKGQFNESNINKFIRSHVYQTIINSSQQFKNVLKKMQQQSNRNIVIENQLQFKQENGINAYKNYVLYWVNSKQISMKQFTLKQLIYAVKRINRFIIRQEQQFQLILQDFTQNNFGIKEGILIKYKNNQTIISLKSQSIVQQNHIICQIVQQNLKNLSLSLPEYACIQEYLMQDFIIKKQLF